MQDNAHRKYSEARVYFKTFCFQHCERASKFFTTDIGNYNIFL